MAETRFPSNSKMKPQPKEHQKVEAVVTGEVLEQKPALGKRIFKMFFSGDMQDVKRYAIEELILPGLKHGFLDILGRMILSDGYSGYTPYARNVKTTTRNGTTVVSSSRPSAPARATYFADDGKSSDVLRMVVFTRRDDAKRVLDILNEQIAMYEEATLMQYYDACKLTSEFTDEAWGWTSLMGVDIRSVRGGYMLNLPQPIQLDTPF